MLENAVKLCFRHYFQPWLKRPWNPYRALLNWIVDYEPDIFSALSDDYSSLINKNLFNSRRCVQLKNGYYAETNLSAEAIHRFCGQVIQRVGLSSDDWKVETE